MDRHSNQQSIKNIWFDAELVKTMWENAMDEGDHDPSRGSYASGLKMEMTEEEYRDLPRSDKRERRRAKNYDNLKIQ